MNRTSKSISCPNIAALHLVRLKQLNTYKDSGGNKTPTFWLLCTQFLRRNNTINSTWNETWHATIYPTTQCTNRQILTSAKIQFWPSTHVVDAASFVKISRNSRQAKVITHSTGYQTLWADENSGQNCITTKSVKRWGSWAPIGVKLLSMVW